MPVAPQFRSLLPDEAVFDDALRRWPNGNAIGRKLHRVREFGETSCY
jgi:hypothetical protein